MTKILLSGTLLNAREAHVAVDDRGFRFGDGVFETIPVHAGVPYLMEYHLERLEGGMKALKIPFPVKTLPAQARRLLKENHVREGLLRIAVSRGAGSRGYLPQGKPQPTLVMQTLPKPRSTQKPVTLWLSSYEKISPKALPVQFKLAQGLSSTLARMEAEAQGSSEALLLAADGAVAEASAANIFWLKEEKLYTPALSTGALAGVTRRRIMELSPYPIIEGHFDLETLAGAEAVVLANAAQGIMPVSRLKPSGITWKSPALAAALTGLRTRDIAEYTTKKGF